MTLINSCSGMALKIVQRSNAPNDGSRNLESHYRAKGTREILHLSHEINGKTMEPGGDPFKLMMEIDRLAADLHRLGDKSVTELRKCVIIVSGLSADFEMECRILENNPAGLNRAEIEHVVGISTTDFPGSNMTRRHCRYRRAPSRRIAGRGRTGDPITNSKVTASIAERKVAALETAGARKRVKKKSGVADDKKKDGGSGRCYICGSEEHLVHRHCGLLKSLEHRRRDYEERGDVKGVQCWQNLLCRRFLR